MPTLGRRRALLAGAGAVASLLAGCSGDGGDDDPADRGPISVEELVFAAERPAGYDEYEPQPDATYERGDVVWLYADYEGLSGEPVSEESPEAGGDDGDGGGADETDGREEESPATAEIDLHHAVTVVDPNGDPVVESETTFEEELAVPQLERYFTGTEILLPGDVAAGEYETTVSVADRVSETEDVATATFRIDR